MKVRAIKVIRSSHLSADIIKPGAIGTVLSERIELTGRKIYRVLWEQGFECVALPTDIELLEDIAVAAPAATASLSARHSEVASSSRDTLRPTPQADRPGLELVGSQPFLHPHEWLQSRAWFSELHDLGGD